MGGVGQKRTDKERRAGDTDERHACSLAAPAVWPTQGTRPGGSPFGFKAETCCGTLWTFLKEKMELALPPSGCALPSLFQGSVCTREWVHVRAHVRIVGTCMCAHTHARSHVWVHVHTRVHMYAHMCGCTRTCVHSHVWCMCAHTCVRVAMYAHMCECMCVFSVCVGTPGAVSSEGGSTAGPPSTLCGHSPRLFVPQSLQL